MLRFKNLKRRALRSLGVGYDLPLIESYGKRLDHIENDTEFWNYQHGGLGVFLGPGFESIQKMRRPVEDVAIVADRFYLKPLIYLFQTLDQFLVLAISMNHVKLFSGDRDRLEQEEIKELDIAYRDFWGERNVDRRIVSMAVAGNSGALGKSKSLFHNYDDVHARKKIDLTRYFSAIDQVVSKVVSSSSSVPVVLAALPEYQDLYRSVSHIRGLVDKGILVNPDVMVLDDLRKKAWDLIRPVYENMATKLNEEYSNAFISGKASDVLLEIAKALSRGRVGKLLIERDRRIPGKFMEDTGLVLFADLQNPHINDLLDDFADVVMRNSGSIMVLPREKMPSDSGVAAIYRY